MWTDKCTRVYETEPIADGKKKKWRGQTPMEETWSIVIKVSFLESEKRRKYSGSIERDYEMYVFGGSVWELDVTHSMSTNQCVFFDFAGRGKSTNYWKFYWKFTPYPHLLDRGISNQIFRSENISLASLSLTTLFILHLPYSIPSPFWAYLLPLVGLHSPLFSCCSYIYRFF